MTTTTAFLPRSAGRGPVIALHCSGSGAGQWRQLGEALGPGYELIAPEHYGTESAGPWTGEHAFTLADEAERTLALIDRACAPVHLVGHSYGGGVALRVAIERPGRIASLSLYEPTTFHVLKELGADGAAALSEIGTIARIVSARVITGDYRSAAATFVDYWNGPGAWAGLRPQVQAALTRWAPKVPLDFCALIDERTLAASYRRIQAPMLIMRGEHAPAPTRLIAGMLTTYPTARLAVVGGAGHMGPITHAGQVNRHILRHIAAASERASQQLRARVAHHVPEEAVA
jgi:pimeloyl-ACP methyl ester carboxylesterase